MHNLGLNKEKFVSRWGRRFISISSIILATLMTLALLPLWLSAALLFDTANHWVFKRKTSAVNGGLFILWYLLCECYGVLCSLTLFLANAVHTNSQRYINWNYQLQAHWASILWAGATSLFKLNVKIEDNAQLDAKPMILLLRHASIADALLATVLITVPYKVRFRFVMKRELLWDPCLDIVGQRLPNYFVNRGASNHQTEIDAIGSLSNHLRDDEGLLIYPEGTRYTVAKRQRIIDRFKSENNIIMAKQAEQLKHLLMPKVGGVNALLEKKLPLDVVIASHIGFESVISLNQLWSGVMLNSSIAVRLQRFACNELPRDKVNCSRWLYQRWLEIDHWIESMKHQQ